MCDPGITSQALTRRGFMGVAALGAALTAAGCAPAGGTGAATTAPATPGASAGPLSVAERGYRSAIVPLGIAGGPPPEIGVAGTSTALAIGERTYVIDAGRGSVTQFANSRLPFDSIRSMFITHLHVDHTVDLFDYFMLPGFGINDSGDGILEPFELFGPGPAGALPEPWQEGLAPATVAPDNPTPGIRDFVDLQMQAFAYSINLFLRDSGITDPRDLARITEIALPDSAGASANTPAPTMEPFEVHDDGTVRVTATLVPHGPVYPAFAFRFDTADGSVVVSGDTSRSENLIRLAKGADYLLHEVIDLDFYANWNVPEALLDHLRKSHTDLGEVGPIAQEAEVGTLVLHHLVPGDPALIGRDHWLEGAQRGFDGEVVLAEELTPIVLAE